MQYGSFGPAAHSALLAHGRHCVVPTSQMGDVGVLQSTAPPQCPQAPVVVHTSGFGQSSGDLTQALQECVVASQTGLFPLQPALACAASHSAHCPATQRVFPSERPAQSVASRQATQLAGEPAQKRSASRPVHTRPEPGPHSQVRAVHAAVTPVGHATPQFSHSSGDVFRHVTP